MHLPRDWMYTARLPRTKLLSLRPTAVFDGDLEVDGETIAVDGWPGDGRAQLGRGARRDLDLASAASRSTGAGPDTWLDVTLGRIRLGPIMTPWVANGAVSLDGRGSGWVGPGRRVSVLGPRTTVRPADPRAAA